MDTTNLNVNRVERRASTALGGVLLLWSLSRRSLRGAVMAAALLYRGVSGHSYLYQALGVNTADNSKQGGGGASNDALEIEHSITIGRSVDELYRFWSDPQNLSQIMGDFAEVTAGSENRMHWQVRGPLDRRIEWDTQIVEDRSGEMQRWQSLDGALLPNEGSVHFRPAPGDRGTEVTLHFHFTPPGGTIGNTIMKSLSIVPRMLAEKALRRFKSLVETGEIPTLKRNPAARTSAYVEHSYAHQ